MNWMRVAALALGISLFPVSLFAQSPPSSYGASQNPFAGSAPAGKATGEVLQLSFDDAMQRGLKQNLGTLLTEEGIGAARGQRWRELSNLLPNVTTQTSENVAEVNLAAQGIKIHVPGFAFPNIVGPFSFINARAYFTQNLFNWQDIQGTRAAQRGIRAAEYSYQDAREMVVYVVSYNYLLAIADGARVDTAEAQVKSAQAIYEQTSDQHNAGLVPAIDSLRAQVELQTLQQQLIVARNDLAKEKLALARAIGLPPGQAFEVTEKAPYEPFTEMSLDEALANAYRSRSDYLALMEQLRSAALQRRAASAEYFPTLSTKTDYGDIGTTLGHSHGTVDFSATLTVPIFLGGRVKGDVMVAEAALQQQRAQLENLRGQIDQDVRSAMLDLQSAAEQVKVAESNVELADQTLAQSRDRFAAGVTDTVEVVQAQEAVARAHESYISSLYAFNLAKIGLARAMGLAQKNVQQLWKGN
ncbi:MAG: TolC family protein [Candidatus Acidiferrales bacterium]